VIDRHTNLVHQFLSFFRMASKFLGIAFIFALVVITPVHFHYREGDRTQVVTSVYTYTDPSWLFEPQFTHALNPGKDITPDGYLWMYVVFVYVFTGLAVHLLISETKKIIRIRQRYLGHQSTVTDRTIRLSGIPENLKSEDKIKEHIEALEIGKVESVTLCRNWKEIDGLMDKRMVLLRKLEEAWTVHLGYRHVERSLESLPAVQPPPPEPTPSQETDNESGALLTHDYRDQDHVTPYAKERPTTRVRYGFLKLKCKKVDAINFYEEQLRKLDERIRVTREKEFEPTALAFVTMDSVAACVSSSQGAQNALNI
jgi:calcium permeable stress-gated cation channel